METEAEVRAGRLQGLERQGLRGATRSWERGLKQIPLGAPRRSKPCHHLDLGLLAPRTVRQDISVVTSSWYFATAAPGD